MAEIPPTATLLAVTTELRKRMGNIPTSGVGNCRAKNVNGVSRPDLGYSEHAFGNAEDLSINGYSKQKPYVDMLNKMKGEGYPVGLILWAGARADHTDHIHVEGSPALEKGQKPPCAGGAAIKPGTVPTGLPTGTTDEPGFFDWFTDPAGAVGTTVGNALSEIVPRIIFGLVALIALVLLVVILTKALAEKTGLVGVATTVATKGKL